MLLDKYDLYDIHFLLVGVRFAPAAACNAEVIRTVMNILSSPQESNTIEANIVRVALRGINGLDRESWIYADNIYTYGQRIIKDEFCYSFLARGFQLMLDCANGEDYEKLRDLADALHNIPILFADGCRNFKKATKLEFDHYNKKYKENLFKYLATTP